MRLILHLIAIMVASVFAARPIRPPVPTQSPECEAERRMIRNCEKAHAPRNANFEISSEINQTENQGFLKCVGTPTCDLNAKEMKLYSMKVKFYSKLSEISHCTKPNYKLAKDYCEEHFHGCNMNEAVPCMLGYLLGTNECTTNDTNVISTLEFKDLLEEACKLTMNIRDIINGRPQ